MSYIINKTDGSILATVADGQVDTLTTNITLIGKNYSGFGEALNENFVKILENFSGSAAPSKPIRGQIWFDTAELKLKVYNGLGFQPVSSATIANSQPTTLGVGDLWFNDIDKQLYFFDGTSTILLGPDFSVNQGLSGLKVVSLLDTLNQNRVITILYNNGILLGIFAKDAFTPKVAIAGFEGSIGPGFNAGSLSGIKFNVTATNAEQLGGQPANVYVRNDTSNIINGQLILTSNLGLVIGDAGQGLFQVQNGNILLANIASNRNFTLNLRRGVIQEPAIFVESANRTVNFYREELESEVYVGGNLTVQGNFEVKGEITTVSSSILTVEDKNIELARIAEPTDAYADGGGIIVKGASDHSLLWSLAGASWDSTEHINLVSGKSFKIDGVDVVTATSLGTSITSIPGVTSFGTQTRLTIGPILAPGNPPTPYIEFLDNRISTLITNQNLEIAPNGNGNVVLIGSPKISGLANPTLAQDAATKEYVDDEIQTRAILFSLDVSDGISNSSIAALLTSMAPPVEFRNGTIGRVLCSTLSNSASSVNLNPLLVLDNSTEFRTADGGSAFAVTNVVFNSVIVPAPVIAISRVVKTFQLVAGAWTFIS
jgi:hypothetical protein